MRMVRESNLAHALRRGRLRPEREVEVGGDSSSSLQQQRFVSSCLCDGEDG